MDTIWPSIVGLCMVASSMCPVSLPAGSKTKTFDHRPPTFEVCIRQKGRVVIFPSGRRGWKCERKEP